MPNWLPEVFGTQKPIVAMHLAPLPGDPGYELRRCRRREGVPLAARLTGDQLAEPLPILVTAGRLCAPGPWSTDAPEGPR